MNSARVLNDIQLRGEHNVRNVLAAVVLAASADISAEAISEAIRTFTGIPSPAGAGGKVDGVVAYVNDSIATAPERAIAAVRAYDEPLICSLVVVSKTWIGRRG